VDKTAAQQTKVQQFETDGRQGLGFKNFLLIFLDLIIHQKVPELKLISKQEFHGLMDKTTAQQPKVQQFESTAFQDPQAAATSGNQHHYVFWRENLKLPTALLLRNTTLPWHW
jgi:hypothetical protein